MSNTYFSGVLDISGIPSNKLVRITEGGNAVATTPKNVEVPLLYDDTLSVKASSSFGGIGDPQGNNFLTLLSGCTGGAVPSGQFALQSVQVWQSTDPIVLDFKVKLEMLSSGKDEVVIPSLKLMKLCLPSISENSIGSALGLLVPPGPNLDTMLQLSGSSTLEGISDYLNFRNSGSLVEITVGKFTFSNCIVTEVTPEFSNMADEDGYPISAELNIEAQTAMIATKGMIDSLVK